MSSSTRLTLLLAAGLAAALPALAQPIYRCGNSYSHQPCESAVPVAARDARDDRQRAEADKVAASEQALAETMRRERRARERAAPARAINLGQRAASAPQTELRPVYRKLQVGVRRVPVKP